MRSTILRFAFMAAIGAGLASTAKADITFNPTGNGLASETYTISGLGYGPGNALAVNAISGGGLQVGSTFDLLFQTNLTSLVGAPNAAGDTGLNVDYQITMVATIRETVTSITNIPGVGTIATFALDAGGPNQVSIYYNNAVTFDPAAGTGFTDGQVIASLTINELTSGYFDTTALDGTAPFNTTGSGNGLGSTSNQGTGSSNIGALVNSYDSAFFQAPSGSPALISSFLNVGVNPIFDAIPASILFGAHVAQIGAINGQSGPDFQLQVSGFTQSFVTVPEPSSIALAGLGFACTLAYSRRRAQRKAV